MGFSLRWLQDAGQRPPSSVTILNVLSLSYFRKPAMVTEYLFGYVCASVLAWRLTLQSGSWVL